MKTMEDAKCDIQTALAWAAAKNALQNRGGYSPNQLVFGTNVNLPSVITDLVPALESFTSSDIARQNVNGLHDTKKNFIKAESSERIKQALQEESYAPRLFLLVHLWNVTKKRNTGLKKLLINANSYYNIVIINCYNNSNYSTNATHSPIYCKNYIFN